MPRKRQRSQMAAIDQINMTPLLDLTFLLLIVFMISMPLMEYGTDVSTPEMNSARLPDKEFKYVNLKSDGSVEMDKTIISRAELEERLRVLKAASPKLTINLRADASRNYGDVMEVMKIVKRAGFTNISLVTQAERK